jgi:hypothetical protein
MEKLLEEFRKTLDKSLDMEKAESLIRDCWDGNKGKFCVHKLLELILNSESIDMRKKEDFTSDIVLITANAVYQSFLSETKEVVFIRSISELAKILNTLKTSGYFKRTNGSEMTSYDIPSGTTGFSFPPTFLVDVEMLETFGLLYRIIKVAKFGERFQQRYQLRISGWGRDYIQRNLSSVHDLLTLSTRLKEYFDGVLKANKEKYITYFEKVREEAEDVQDVSAEVKELAKDLPIKVMVS